MVAASYQFNISSSQVLATTGLSLGYPLFLTAWINPHTTVTGPDIISAISQATTNRGFSIQTAFNTTVTLRVRGSVATVSLSSTTTLSVDQWYHIVGISRSSTDHELYINGVSETTSSTDAGIASTWSVHSLGAYYLSGTANEFINARIAYTGYGETDLTDADVEEMVYNPQFAASKCTCFYYLNEDGASAVGDFKDIKAVNSFSVGTVPSEYSGGPPIFFPGGQ